MIKNQTSQELILDIYGCSLKTISSKKKIKEFVDKICLIIRMKKYGQLQIERFGQNSSFGEGYSFLQFIETSSISGHFLENKRIAYLNIFSCQSFNKEKVIQFTKKFFESKGLKSRLIIRK